MENVAIIGASNKEGRYARLAQESLIKHGHRVFPVAPRPEPVLGVESFKNVEDIPDEIDTITVYVRPEIMERYVKPIIKKGVKRIIFNPGTESETIEAELKTAGILVEEACTLILLNTGQF